MTAGDIIVISEEAGGRKGNYFDGTDDYVLHDAHAVARVAAGDTTGTYTAWIYSDDAVAGNHAILSAGDNNAATEYLLIKVLANQLKVKLVHGGATQFEIRETTGSIQSKTWHQIGIVQNGIRPTLYVDGKPVAMTDDVGTDKTAWYGTLTACDKFAIGVLESNATHTVDFEGAIGQVKYWDSALTNTEILAEYNATSDGTAFGTTGTPVFNITMEIDGITDAGTGADNGTLTGHAFYGGWVSDWSYHLQFDGHITGHAAEDIEHFIDGSKYVTVIRRGD